MTLNELNKRYEDLKRTSCCLEKAMIKFEKNNNVDNYLCYEILQLARECVISEMNRFANQDWK